MYRRKSCRASLDKHNARRRRKSSTGGSAAPGSPPAAQERPGGGRSAPYTRGRELHQQHPQHQRQHAEQHAQRQRGYSPPPAAAGPDWGDRHAANRYPPAQRGTAAAAAGVDGWGPPPLSYQRGELRQQYAHPQGLPPASLHDLLPPPAPEELEFLHSTQQQALLRELLGGAAAAAAPPGGDGGLPSAQALAAALEQVPGLLQMAAAAEGQGPGALPQEVMDALEQAPSLLQAASSLAHAASARSGSLPLWAAPPAGPPGPSLAPAMAGPSPRQQQQQQAAWQVKQEPAAPCTVPPSPASAFAALAHKPFQGLSLPGQPQPGGWLKQDPEGGAAGSWLAAHLSSHGSTALPPPTLGPGGWPEQAQHAQQQCYPPSQAHTLYPLPGGYAPPGEAELPPSPVPTAPLPTPWQRWPSAEPSRLGSLEVQPGKAMSSGQQAWCAPEGDCGASQLPPVLQVSFCLFLCLIDRLFRWVGGWVGGYFGGGVRSTLSKTGV